MLYPYITFIQNVRSMNQSKLKVVKQEMERVNINILEIGELNKMDWNGRI